jgi:murein DD-endopeptidase MepM/ murein hydrolase activator NlpD
VRSRSLFVRHAPLRRLGRATARAARGARPRDTGLLGPLAIAVGLAVAGHSLAGSVPVSPAPVRAVSAYAADRPEHTLPGSASGPVRAHQNTVSRTIPAAPRVRARASRSARARWVRPAWGPLTSPFGYRWGKLHKGVDIGAAYGSPIVAAADGVVTYAGPRNGYGRLVTIRHADGTETAYGHMSRIATHVGAVVHAGELIAYVGTEGHSTGPHLHFEVHVGGVPINPIPFLRARGVFL